MYCKTEDEAIDFCNYLHSVGRKWHRGESYFNKAYWHPFTVYYFNEGTTGSLFVIEKGYTTLNWSDFMNTNKEFTKADLKDGMVVEYRDGSRRMVMGDKVIGHTSYNPLDEYNNALETQYSDATIDKVYKSTSYCLEDYFKSGHLTLVWERKEPVEMTLEEVCKALGKEVKIVKEKTNG